MIFSLRRVTRSLVGVSIGLAVAALTGTCAMGMLLSKLPYNRGASCDLDSIVGQLRDGTAGRP